MKGAFIGLDIKGSQLCEAFRHLNEPFRRYSSKSSTCGTDVLSLSYEENAFSCFCSVVPLPYRYANSYVRSMPICLEGVLL